MSRLVFFGTADFSAPTLDKLIENAYEVVAVITKPDSPAGRGRKLSRPRVAEIADQHGIPVLQPVQLDGTFVESLARLKATAGIVVSYGRIIPQTIIDLFPKGLINIHASLLPKYRGPSPIEAAILNGDSKTGVSLMQIDAGLDTGPVFASSEITLHGVETRPELYDQLSQLGADLLIEKLPQILDGSLKPEAQNDSDSSLTHLIKKDDGDIDWNQPAEKIERLIRAYKDWPSVKTKDGIHIVTAHIEKGLAPIQPGLLHIEDNQLLIGTSDQSLAIDRLKVPGKNEMSAADYIRGHKK